MILSHRLASNNYQSIIGDFHKTTDFILDLINDYLTIKYQKEIDNE